MSICGRRSRAAGEGQDRGRVRGARAVRPRHGPV